MPERIATPNRTAGFIDLGLMEDGLLSPRSVAIVTFALCGFANFSSIAIQIGGIGGIAPDRKSDLARLGLRAVGQQGPVQVGGEDSHGLDCLGPTG